MYNSDYIPNYTKLSTERSFSQRILITLPQIIRISIMKNLKGAHTLAFFGYTNCPDYCPDTLMKIRQVFRKIENNKKIKDINMLFISVDTSDNITKIKKYVEYFDSRFVGIATRDTELKELTKRIGVYYKEISTDNDIKFFDHTSAVFVINKESKLIGLYTPPIKINYIYEDIINSFN